MAKLYLKSTRHGAVLVTRNWKRESTREAERKINNPVFYKEGVVKIYQDLFINLHGYQVETLIETITSRCGEQWVRAYERENDVKALGENFYFFERSENENIKNAALALCYKSNDIWYVPNIIPLQLDHLSQDEYNRILNNFVEELLFPAIKDTPVSIKIIKDEIYLREVAGNEIHNLLTRFSAVANKSTGSSYPSDQKRWFAFICAVNNAGKEIRPDLLVHTLMEQGWAEDSSNDLAEEFEFAQELLNFYKEK